MSAPANDNIANATPITGASGNTTGSNASATVETGEPTWRGYNNAASYPTGGNPFIAAQATVWFVWTCPTLPAPIQTGYTYPAPTTQQFYFSTVDPATNFQSVVQVFTLRSATVAANNLAEVAVVLDERQGAANGAANGASVSFIATVGTTYYIRIGGRNGATGNYKLNWSTWDWPTLGACNKCGPTTLGGQIDCFAVTNSQVAQTHTFPTVPAGIYAVAYCKGAEIFTQSGPAIWTVGSGLPNPEIDLTAASGATLPSPGWAGLNANSQAEMEIAAQCMMFGPFQSCGDTFTIKYQDSIYPDNIDGKPNPVFQLIEVSNGFLPGLIHSFSGSSLSGSGTSWSGTFVVGCNFLPGLTGVTVELLNTDGISGASAAQTVNLTSGSSLNDLTFTFNADLGASFCTAVLQFSICGNVFATLEYPLYPIITLSASGTTGSRCFNGSTPIANEVNQFFNTTVSSIPTLAQLGISGITLTGTSSPLNLVNGSANLCPVISSATGTVTNLNGTTVDPLKCTVLEPSSTTSNTYTVAITCASLSYPNFVYTTNVS